MDTSMDHRFGLYSKMNSPSNMRAEPMIMGSPSSPHPGSHNTSQYLPGYLLGDQTPGASTIQSPAQATRGLWSPATGNGLSTHRLASQSSIQMAPSFSSSKKFSERIEDASTPGRSKDKLSAPPVSGLLDTSVSAPSHNLHLMGPHTSVTEHTESKHQLTLGFSSPLPSGQQHAITQMSQSTPAMAVGSNSSFQQTMNTSTTLLSPPQVDPFYTQGEELSPHDCLDETWVTVFGFSQGAAGHILQQFNEYGTILEHVICNEGNWMHIHYKSKIAAKKALSKNGKVIGNNMMVGVSQCIDQGVMAGKSSAAANKSPDSNITMYSVQHTVPLKTLGTLCESGATPSKTGTPIRPLTKAYSSSTPADVPKSSGKTEDVWWKKAMEYAFGW